MRRRGCARAAQPLSRPGGGKAREQARRVTFHGDMTTRRGRANAWLDSLVADHGLLRLGWTNWGVVAPGRVYRCNHPTPGRLARACRRHGLRTIINLRGLAGNGSDALTREMAARLGVDFVDVTLFSRGPPPRAEVLKLAETFRTMREPALLHCKSGADRAGLAAGLFLLLEGASPAEALGQLSLRHLHFRQSRTGILDAFLLSYIRDAEGRKGFLDWVREEYDEAALLAEFRAHGLARFRRPGPGREFAARLM